MHGLDEALNESNRAVFPENTANGDTSASTFHRCAGEIKELNISQGCNLGHCLVDLTEADA